MNRNNNGEGVNRNNNGEGVNQNNNGEGVNQNNNGAYPRFELTTFIHCTQLYHLNCNFIPYHAGFQNQ